MITLQEIAEQSVQFDKIYQTLLSIIAAGPSPRPVSGAVVINEEKKFLLVYSDFANQGWFFPKGGNDASETTLEASKREAFEESGIKVSTLLTPKYIEISRPYVFNNKLGFGSPRFCGEGSEISQSAYDLLKQTVLESKIEGVNFEQVKYPLFDKFKDTMLKWVNKPIRYHMFSHVGHETPGGTEVSDIKWVTFEELNQQPKLHSHSKLVMLSPIFKEVYNSL